ncbi:hypothetical protein DM02DRAFT_83069 [Periconia macrospinosa]|uniref:Uncharacterized protein n=1 Tax=Periconia macrospinosa TaxID=97972 RepID=A0A2V1E8D8_9PLEO|nr:hypothetical protein DM02DRAFT_83069 [Periconia macrospinosa]
MQCSNALHVALHGRHQLCRAASQPSLCPVSSYTQPQTLLFDLRQTSCHLSYAGISREQASFSGGSWTPRRDDSFEGRARVVCLGAHGSWCRVGLLRKDGEGCCWTMCSKRFYWGKGSCEPLHAEGEDAAAARQPGSRSSRLVVIRKKKRVHWGRG